MSRNSKIEWTDHTFNPWWGCRRVSPGCDHCYAERLARITGGADLWGANGERRFFGDKHWSEPLRWEFHARHRGERQRVFAGSMCDVFEDRPDLIEPRRRLWDLIQRTPHLDWILLTKRPENIPSMLPSDWGDGWWNVWLLTTVENDDYLPRLWTLAQVPSRVRGVSMEPLIDLSAFQDDEWESVRLDWIIVGGETGPGARPMQPLWVRIISGWCADHGVAFFFKGWGGKSKCRLLDGREWNEVPSVVGRSPA